jgi:hypothetical protein
MRVDIIRPLRAIGFDANQRQDDGLAVASGRMSDSPPTRVQDRSGRFLIAAFDEWQANSAVKLDAALRSPAHCLFSALISSEMISTGPITERISAL